jgi:hypothetical protein
VLLEKSPIHELALLANNNGEILVSTVEASTVTVILAEAGIVVSFDAGAEKLFGVHPSIKKPMEPAKAGSAGVTIAGMVSGLLLPPLLSPPPFEGAISFLQNAKLTVINRYATQASRFITLNDFDKSKKQRNENPVVLIKYINLSN